MSSLRKAFGTDAKAESEGVELDYRDFAGCIITVARAGGGNKEFEKARTRMAAANPGLARGKISEEKARALLLDVYAQTVIKNWQTEVDGKLKQGIEGPDGKLLPFTPKNVKATLRELPELFDDIRRSAESAEFFRSMDLEEQAGN